MSFPQGIWLDLSTMAPVRTIQACQHLPWMRFGNDLHLTSVSEMFHQSSVLRRFFFLVGKASLVPLGVVLCWLSKVIGYLQSLFLFVQKANVTAKLLMEILTQWATGRQISCVANKFFGFGRGRFHHFYVMLNWHSVEGKKETEMTHSLLFCTDAVTKTYFNRHLNLYIIHMYVKIYLYKHAYI